MYDFLLLTFPHLVTHFSSTSGGHAELRPRRIGTTVVVVRRNLRQEVGRHEAAYTSDLAHEEAILVHIAVYVDDVARAERQLHLWMQERIEEIIAKVKQVSTECYVSILII